MQIGADKKEKQSSVNATGLHVGLLVNFSHHPKLEYERMVHTLATSRE
jgi:hypothetical protein